MTVVLYILLLLAEQQGQVMFGGVPVPGATVTASQGDKKFVAVTDQQGTYSFSDLPDGPFTIQVEMLGFTTVKQEVTTPKAEFELKMLPIEEMRAEIVRTAPPEPTPAPAVASGSGPNARQPAAAPARPAGFQRTEVNAANTTAANAPANETPAPQSGAFANLSQEDLNQRAADGFLINGSVNNGAATPFAQIAQFGNNRRGRPLYTGGANVVIDNSALNARAFSLTGQDTPKPAYNKFTGAFNIGGPLRIPGLSQNNAPTFFVSYQRTQNRTGNTLTGRMPTAAERNGDFTQSINPLGQPVQIVDPGTGLPFAGNIIPQGRISPQARALLNLFPLPNFTDNARYNYQVPSVDATHQDGIQGRLNKSINPRNQLAFNIDLQSSRGDNSNLFNFLDTSRSFGINGAAQWTTRPTQRFSATFRYQYSRQSTRTTPYFANQINVSGIAGISGNNQDAPYWGPPALNFSGGTSTLSDGQYSFNRTQNNTFVYSSFWNRGRHNVTFGSDLRRYQFNALSQQDARGTFTFTGATTRSDLASFLLGIPDTSSIAFGNADKYFRQTFVNAFIADDFRMSGALTLNLGLRWEYETPIDELRGRLVNLDIASGFTSITPVIGNGLIKDDKLGIQPRVSFAWRPIAASSVIVRGSYGVYRNTNVYQAIAVQMAQQSPLSKSLSVQNTPANPLTLANGFVNVQGTTPNTFAVDPDFRVGYVQTWQLSLQRDLPAALQMTAMYLGTKGTRLPQEYLPNTFPAGAVNPSGYVFLSSNGNSIRNSAQIQLRRRLRSGFTATAQYTYSRAFDNAPLMAGGIVTANQGGTAIAQNWLDLGAERAPSSFDQRHQVTLQSQYTTGVGVRGGALLSGWRGALFKEWTLASQLTIGSGLPQTPIYFAAVPGTGVTGNLRPVATGISVKDAPAGLFLNPAAYRAPAPGEWGNAGRNSITGPAQFSLNAQLGRSFPWRDRYNIDVRVDATNVLNHVTFRSWNTTINNGQFGLPTRYDPMRSIQTTVRLRF
jgi:trimeric autotransporter adhesin